MSVANWSIAGRSRKNVSFPSTRERSAPRWIASLIDRWPAWNAFADEIPRLQHLERHKPVEGGERGITEVVDDRLIRRHSRGALVFDGGNDPVTPEILTAGKMGAACYPDPPVEHDVVEAFQLR